MHRAWVTGQHRRDSSGPSRSAAPPHSAGTAIAVTSVRSRLSRTTAAVIGIAPKRLTAARNAWVAAREQELLPVGYVHLVFTLPEPLARLALVSKRVVCYLLFQAVANTLLQVAKESAARPPGGAIGGLMVLHTWGQRLQHHPHVHCVVPMGGLAPDGPRRVHARPRFFLPIPVLRKLFRGKLVAGVRDAFRNGRLPSPGQVGNR